MEFKLQILAGLLLVSPSLCQIVMDTVMKPDVTFGEHNDRFDIANLVEEQHNLEAYLAANRRHRYKQAQKQEKIESSSSESLRRSGGQYHPGRLFARRFAEADFAYHDNMASDAGDNDFEKALEEYKNKNARRRLRNFVKYLRAKPKRRNLKKIRKTKKSQRRSFSLDDLVLHYEVPRGLKISGFVKAPGDI